MNANYIEFYFDCSSPWTYLAFSEISTLKNLNISLGDNKKILKNSIKNGKLKYMQTQKLSLPPVITILFL